MSFDYTGFKLAEKKKLKDFEHYHATAEKQIQDKLGADWKLTVDWPTFHKFTCETASNDRAKSERPYLNVVYERYCAKIGEELSKWDADTVEAVNDAVKDKEIVITMDENEVDARYTVKVGSKIVVLMQQDKITYEYPYSAATTITAVVQNSL